MENGEGHLESKFTGLTVSDPNNINGSDGLFQVMKAVEAAEATIKQQCHCVVCLVIGTTFQVEENNRLRSELQKKNEELEKYVRAPSLDKSGDEKYQDPQFADQWGDHEPSRTDQVVLHLGNQIVGGGGDVGITSKHDSPNSFALESDPIRSNNIHAMRTHIENQNDSNTVNGSLNMAHGGQVASDNSGVSQILSPSITLFTPTRYQQESNLDSEFGYSGRDLISMADSSSKQDIVVKIREHEDEILQLKKHLTEYSIKEAQISNEKYALEKRISYMRLAFDQQQQDLILAASKAVSYRQDIMEENVRLTYALQAAQQERSTFITSLMPLLTEYSLQPPVADAQSIVSNVKVLFRHLQEQLLVTEGKLKDSQYQLAPWRSDVSPSNFAQSPIYPIEIKDGMELVPQPTYSDGNMPSSDPQTAMVGDILGLPQSGLDNMKNLEHDELGMHPPLANRTTESASREVSSQLSFNQADPHNVQNNEGSVSKKVTFGDLVRSNEMDEPDNRGHPNYRELSGNWNSKASATPTLDDPNSYAPYLPPVLEEPSSSFSEAADDDPLPAIEGLQISGEAFPGQQLQACGYSINGTTSCNFEWVRHMEDGSFNYVDGAKQPNYLITADDVDTYLAIEVQPLDDRKRKGELVKVFANEHRKITCDPVMHKCIEKTLYTGHASYKLSLSIGYLDIWEPAVLAIKRDGYSIKCSGPSGVVVTEKFSSSTIVSIPYGSLTEFSVVDSLGTERILRVDTSLTDFERYNCSHPEVIHLKGICLWLVKRRGRREVYSLTSEEKKANAPSHVNPNLRNALSLQL
ncbi:hypothetical protein PHJA_000474400 [Phtheirospermum japonicum]|uniref:Uncharacterized protein n=1 Tax=Phtheirospermum japonicum TaxID=374723 RepID=A0A830B6L6_9LAMI|nr:hypothetical protein PHJA_000474400 [Phtheirospermum japonicum]